MDVIILAGGLGTRLRSVVSEVPKCMAPIRSNPFLEYLLNQLKAYNINKVILSVGYLSEIIYNWVEEVRDNYPFKIEFSKEDEPLGTGGAIKKALNLVTSEEAFIVNGDTFFNIDFNEFLRLHTLSASPISLALKPMTNFNRYGNVELNENGQIINFSEKKECSAGQINGGIYILNRELLLSYNLPTKFSFEVDFLQKIVKENLVHGYLFDNYFIDIGVPEDYERGQIEL